MVQNGIVHCVVRSYPLDIIWHLWHPWSKLIDITIQPCNDFEETISLIKQNNLEILE